MASVNAPIKKVRYISVILRLLIPRLSGKSNRMAIAATAEIVKPMLTSAEPSSSYFAIDWPWLLLRLQNSLVIALASQLQCLLLP